MQTPPRAFIGDDVRRRFVKAVCGRGAATCRPVIVLFAIFLLALPLRHGLTGQRLCRSSMTTLW